MIGTIGHLTDVAQSRNAKFTIHESWIPWLAKHGRVPAEILRRAGISDDFDREKVGRAVADLKY